MSSIKHTCKGIRRIPVESMIVVELMYGDQFWGVSWCTRVTKFREPERCAYTIGHGDCDRVACRPREEAADWLFNWTSATGNYPRPSRSTSFTSPYTLHSFTILHTLTLYYTMSCRAPEQMRPRVYTYRREGR